MVIKNKLKEKEWEQNKDFNPTTQSTDGRMPGKSVNSELDFLLLENRKTCEQKRSSLGDTTRWLTTSEAAQYLRVSISSIKTMIYRGQVRAHKLGRRNRFLREELERLITLPVSR